MEASTLKTPASTRPHLNPAFSYRLCYACTRSYHSADCDMHRQPVNVLQDQDATAQRNKEFLTSTSAKCYRPISHRRWHEKKLGVIQPRRSGKHCGTPLIALPLATFGKRNTKTQDWFKAKFSVVTQVIEAKRTVLTEHKRSPSQKKSQLLSAARNKAQQTARNCANEYWKEISNTIQAAAISRDIRGIV